ncbi:glycoside hydrolase family 43 protein [Parathielavia appendiculata]|uniref:Glycoside hydrolase family 43 protein n=1 Tax=Parathielavia appendiculata TaxID=2587402 RepID=A0AAN6UAE3_9PEZI|nr:glycoside hydrolase family 43 protein [Parathielavia appendiculata]
MGIVAATRALLWSLSRQASSLLFLLCGHRPRHRPRFILMLPRFIPTSIVLVLYLAPPTARTKAPLLPLNFPDSCILQDTSRDMSASAPLSPPSSSTLPSSSPTTWDWNYLPEADPLPTPGVRADPVQGSQTWAPAVTQLNQSTYILYYAAQLAGNYSYYHCIGAAKSSRGILGPYDPLPQPVICPLHAGGAIDPAALRGPATGRRYLLYKVNGNSMGRREECNNGVAPFMRTPIVLQEVNATDGVTAVGDGWSVSYAVARNITGPYKRPEGTRGFLIRTGDVFNVTAPGGAASAPGGG